MLTDDEPRIGARPVERPSSSKTLLNVALALIGAVLLLITVRQVGWAEVQRGLENVGWWFLAVVALGGLRFAARARAWRSSAEAMMTASRAPLPASLTPQLFGAMLAADALGNLTPLGLLASEPAKVLLVRHRVPTVAAIASVAIENAFYIASVVAMLAAGAVVFISLTNLPQGLRVGAQIVLASAFAAAVAGLIVARHQPAVLSRIAHLLSAITGRTLSVTGHLEEVEARFYGVLTWPAFTFVRVLFWEAAFHVAAVAEVFLVLRLLPGGSTVSLADAFVLETTGRLIAVVFKFVPYRLGVDEAGAAVVARALAIDPTAGVTLALIRRLRILCWNAIGLIILARSR